MPGLGDLNRLSQGDARLKFIQCCGSRRWAHQMALSLPFMSEEALFKEAVRIWEGLSEEDYREAFAAHPKIGQKPTAKWESEEQAGVSEASATVLGELAQGNKDYEAKFGYLFLVCATGKTADEMLAVLKLRLSNDAKRELSVAAKEQRKITKLRLEKLLQS